MDKIIEVYRPSSDGNDELKVHYVRASKIVAIESKKEENSMFRIYFDNAIWIVDACNYETILRIWKEYCKIAY